MKLHQKEYRHTALIVTAMVLLQSMVGLASSPTAVDFHYSPPEWQTAICLPDDPDKSLVDRSGELLYHYNQGGREFGTRVSVEAAENAVWQKQELESPRVPIVITHRLAEGLEITEEAFAITDLPQPSAMLSRKESSAFTNQPQATGTRLVLQRVDKGGRERNWAKPPSGVDASFGDIAVHQEGSLEYNVAVSAGASYRIALVLCEGWWSETGKRVQVLRVEGAAPRTIDTVADLGKNKAGVFWFDAKDTNTNGLIEITVEAAGADKNTILNGLYVMAPDANPDSEALLAGRIKSLAFERMSTAHSSGPSRNDLILVHVNNTTLQECTLRPRLIVDTTLPFSFQPEAQRVQVNEHETITSSLKMIGMADESPSRRAIQLEPLRVQPCQTAAFFVLYSGGGAIEIEPTSVKKALKYREQAVTYWQKAPLPYGRVQVPDAGVQGLVDSAIRNIWQAREIKKGLPAFQVGPTCYRGLWIVDGAFLLESAAMLGAGAEARNGVAYELTFQQPDGRIQVMQNFSKENGIVLWTCVRHAQLTQDKAWLEALWPKLERIAEHIRTLRQQTLTNASKLDDGLLPAGFPDGGIGGVMDEYTNPYWNLVGLHAFIDAAHWLGKTDSAAAWQREYDDFMVAFRNAAQRDMKKDSHGHPYLPIRMDGQDLPQRGQWAFCQAVYPGQIFAKDEALVAGNMAMLQETEREGMVYGTGWDATGIWNYFGSFYGHAWLWQGNGQKAAKVLAAYANHAAPTLVWREEQSLRGEKFNKVGDMPHNWASAEFIRLTIHLLALDRGDELHLLEGLPPEWTGPGMTTRLSGVATPFGPLDIILQIDRSGKKATLKVKPLAGNCTAIVVHLPDGGTQKISPAKGGAITFPVSRLN
jgi:hypothetical protein